jgi:hypothetical protein
VTIGVVDEATVGVIVAVVAGRVVVIWLSAQPVEVMEIVEISGAEVVIEVEANFVEVIEVVAEAEVISAAGVIFVVEVISAVAVVAAVVLRTLARLSSGLPFTIRCSLKRNLIFSL